MVKFSDLMIRNLKPKRKAYIVREDAPRGEGGFAIRIMPSGAKTWQMIYSFEGKRKWFSLGQYPSMGVSEARDKFREKKKLLSAGQDPGEEDRVTKKKTREALTVEDLCDDFLEKYANVKKRASSAKEDKFNLERDVRPTIGKKKAQNIERADILEIIDSIIARGSGVQANRTLATVRKMFAWALERGIVQSNPAAGISKPTNETPKDRALSIEEITQLWAAMDNYTDLQSVEISKALKLILLTGCRPGEIMSLRWEQVSGGWADILRINAKTNRPYRTYLSTFAREIMGKPQKQGLIVHRYDQTQIPVYALSGWIRAENRLALKAWSPHDLRRTCATRLAEAGTPPHIVQRILNHVARGITGQVYDQYSYSKEIAEALELWGETIRVAVYKDSQKSTVLKLNAYR